MLDFSNKSVKEYSEDIAKYFSTGDATYFPLKIKEVHEINTGHRTLRVISDDAIFIIDHNSFHLYKPGVNNKVIMFHTRYHNSESYGTPHSGFVKRPAQGVSYKEYKLFDSSITRVKKSEARIENNVAKYTVVKHKNKTQHTLRIKNQDTLWGTRVELHEIYDKKGAVSYSYCSVYMNKKSYAVYIKRNSSNHKKFSFAAAGDFKEHKIYDYTAPDASIIHIYDKLLMWDIDLNSSAEIFEIINNVRVQLKNFCNFAISEQGNMPIINTVLDNIERKENEK